MATEAGALLGVERLSGFYGDSQVIRNVSFALAEGETIAIMGRNGMGKTTLLKSLIGLLPVRSGKLSLRNIVAGMENARDKTIPQYVFDVFPVLAEMSARRGGNLSGGQQQQLAIARALVSNPKVLLLDEPTEGIQPSIIKDIARALNRLKVERGFAMVVSEQVLSFTHEIADRFLIMERGELVYEAAKHDVDESRIHSYLTV